MDTLLEKVSDSGLDATSVDGKDALKFWDKVRNHFVDTPSERALCYVISAKYQHELKQYQEAIDELLLALNLLEQPDNTEFVLYVRHWLSKAFIRQGNYQLALNEYIASSIIAVERGFIDQYVQAVMGMGNLCFFYGDYARALNYYKKIDSIDHAIKSRRLRLKYKIYQLSCYLKQKKFKSAKALIKECIELSILISDKSLSVRVCILQARLLRYEKHYRKSLLALAEARKNLREGQTKNISNLLQIEIALGLYEVRKFDITTLLMENVSKKVDALDSPVLKKALNDSLSFLHEGLGDFQQALHFEEQAYNTEIELISQIPIGDLGAAQLRRLSRYELQLKLILSELENRELKATTETQKTTVAQLQQDVFTDPLTMLHNRRWLDVKLKDLLLHETPFILLVVDIDHFKSINDELSHLVGDKAIVSVSQELALHFKSKQASCVRFGGEEFLVILENTTIEQARANAERYRERVYQFNWQEVLGDRGLTVSIGITQHILGENTQKTFYRADKALYQAKANGRNQTCVEF
ncbi:GGDEF domain-containing protein [Vibrio sp. S4M6]|uniref:tetratricopeptide repeat-containing diguanylate cyclase n=1 Tax=Vibrio sinus TaxID=2946865 RepID=UPI002029F0D2|nr:GGDEF domain-containing protein [Vibrio sinus]MCL9780202.1 GGDEF domain-containing protein [Vibrio sinus]